MSHGRLSAANSPTWRSAESVLRGPVQFTYIRGMMGGPSPCSSAAAAATCSKSSGGPDATPSGDPARPSGNIPNVRGSTTRRP